MADRDTLLIEIAGFLNLIAQGIQVPNVKAQASGLIDKIGSTLSSEAPDAGSENA